MKVIRDKKTNKCRGFGFLTVNTQEQADHYIEKFNGYAFGETNLKIEVAQPRNKSDKPEGAEGESPQSTPEASAKPAKRRNRNKNQSSTSSSSGGATQPDPRWASQLQRIKEQLQSANQ